MRSPRVTTFNFMADQPIPPIERYLADVLAPELRSFGVGDRAVQLVASDIRGRLASILSRWEDEAFRRTVLLLGTEEGAFYEPRSAPLEIRALVVAAVRNSLLEDLNASHASRPELERFAGTIRDALMPQVTGAAVEFFARATPDAGPLPPPPDTATDVFGALAARYPRAWCALSALAAMPGTETSYQLAGQDAPVPELPHTPPRRARHLSASLVLNGMSAEIDPALGRLLGAVGASFGFFSDSFKMLTRNPEKLFLVIEYLLARGLPFFTFNYFIGPDYLARREPLLRPAPGTRGSERVIAAKFRDTAGLTARHRDALQHVAKTAA